MGWRGALRSIAAAQRRAERESVRRHRELEKRQKQAARLHELEIAALQVDEYENYVERITSVHRECGDVWDWQAIETTPAPAQPEPSSEKEKKARFACEHYTPGWFDKLFHRIESKRTKLAADLEAAKKADARANAKAQSAYQEALKDWDEMHHLAKRVLSRDPSAYKEAFDEINPLGELSDLGSRILISFLDDGMTANVRLVVNGESVIPEETKSLLKSGKLSTKKTPLGQFFEIYQDYVCGAVLRVAREVFALLPLETVVVTAVSNMLDSSSGHLTDQPILHVVIPRRTIDVLRFESLDPSDALKNFIHRMNFKKTKGFSAIDEHSDDVLESG